ncbi:protein required for cell viability [Drepanopeziza brunnea f. sp. 'multigermtubi' MB_m1]|uniref:Protein required for cell viability n=1 Tax=Marssonina brunnea f. sp. multigermtubi (strain MB_m1) TaxID=1072389 RepID=K1WQJ9_MARBU|nr:protein required for cell viability [Drepanopeziza brunnea f. sp. 'multigermtubi' MB_m1]EKD15271.1 protein required for cell viability [Drepanopeziza brunnea f. sp. 'multigermtubi' MB_m1]
MEAGEPSKSKSKSKSENAQPPLVDSILQLGKPAFDPQETEDTRNSNRQKFNALLESSSTLSLIPVLNLLIQPSRVQPWLRSPLVSALARLPLRPRGVHHTIEFVLQVHPSNSASASTGRGASISHEALNSASRLLSSPPAGMLPEDWFSGIAPQLLSLLDGEGEPGMERAAAFIIGFGVLGRKQFGAPGTPGWNAFVDPILGDIDPTAVSTNIRDTDSRTSPDSIEFLGGMKVLVLSGDVKKGIHRLYTLLTSHPHPSLSKRLLRPILLPLWSLSCRSQGNQKTEREICEPARRLLKTLLQLSPTSTETHGPPSTRDLLLSILENITFKGRSESRQPHWSYASSKDGGVQIEEVRTSKTGASSQLDLVSIDTATDSFISLLQDTPDFKPEISSLFMHLCKKWLAESARTSEPVIITRLGRTDDRKVDTVESSLIEAKVMHKMMTSFPENLVDDSRQVLELVNKVLLDFLATTGGGSGDEDIVAVALSLLNIVLTSPSFKETPNINSCLASIEDCLGSVSRKPLDVSSTAQNLLMLLRFRDSINDAEPNSMATPTERQVEDRKSYSLAMSYLTATDSPPPVRAQGLELLSALIRAGSAILDIPALLVLFSSLLQDDEEYIYLRAIKSFIQLSHRHPKSVMGDLIERYVDSQEESGLDQRLRLGEALLQVIQCNPLAFNSKTSKSVCQGLLFVAGRRGYRPQAEQQQEKKNKLKRKQNSEADEAWGGEVPQLDEVLGESHEDNEILSQIVAGWESKRGQEDVRIRASAISILGSAIEANIEGMGSLIISAALDLSIYILTLEPGPEKGILRRSAIRLIMNFVKALDTARSEGKRLGFGFVGQSLDDVRRVLKYIEGTDVDGLVRQHARDTIEGLEAWEINALIPPPTQREQTSLRELAGLTITPGGVSDPDGRIRPRIVEIE